MKQTLNETLNNETTAVVNAAESSIEKKSRDTFSFRATPDLIADLTAIVKKFSNHKDALTHIVNVCELDAARRVVSDSEAMIDSFQKHLISIERDFLYAIELKKTQKFQHKSLYLKFSKAKTNKFKICSSKQTYRTIKSMS